jgi:hypothetical protein
VSSPFPRQGQWPNPTHDIKTRKRQEERKRINHSKRVTIGQKNMFSETLIGATFTLPFCHNVKGGTITARVQQSKATSAMNPVITHQLIAKLITLFTPMPSPRNKSWGGRGENRHPSGHGKRLSEGRTSPIARGEGKGEVGYNHRKFQLRKRSRKNSPNFKYHRMEPTTITNSRPK